MNDITLFTRYATKIFLSGKVMLSKPVGLILMVPVVASPAFTTPQKALILLAGLFVLDFITGITASWMEFKRSIPVLPASGKRYVIQSSKLKLSAVKFIVYGLTALVARGIEWAFIAKEFEPHESLNKMTLTTMAIAFCCCIELYSIVFENFKRMGFDVIQVIKNASAKGWDLYKTVKDEKTE